MRSGFAVALVALLAGMQPAFAHHVMGGQMPSTFLQGLLSGLGHPVIGLDHLAAMIAVGCLAATQKRGALLVTAFAVAMVGGASAHVGELTLADAEILAALSVVLLGAALVPAHPLAFGASLTLFAAAGAVHGYALAESIVGAQPAPLAAYFAGLVIIQSGIAIGAMTAVRYLSSRGGALVPARLIGAGVAGIGIALLVAQIAPSA